MEPHELVWRMSSGAETATAWSRGGGNAEGEGGRKGRLDHVDGERLRHQTRACRRIVESL